MKKLLTLAALSALVIFLIITINKSKSLDIKDFKNVTPIKSQVWGTCWAFSTIASLESSILKAEMNYSTDLSEYHLDKYNGFNRDGKTNDPKRGWFSTQGLGFIGSNSDNPAQGVMVHLGGDYTMSAAYLSGTFGAVEEEKTPKINSETQFDFFGNSPKSGVLLKNNYSYVFPKKIQWITKVGTNEEKRERIKSAIKEHGSVASAQYMVSTPTTTVNGDELHLNLINPSPNHAITLVGWNDNITFKNHRGAWIVKDSDHINEETNEKVGLFYIPYDDIITGKDKDLGGVIFSEISMRNPKTQIYNHALHGWQYDFKNKESIKNNYKIRSTESLQAVGVYTAKGKDTIEVSIKLNSQIIQKLTHQAEYPGFYYIETKDIDVKEGDIVEVIQNNRLNYYALDSSFWLKVLLAGDEPELKPQWVSSLANRGESYYMKDSKWLDLVERIDQKDSIDFKNANFPIILYTIKHEE